MNEPDIYLPLNARSLNFRWRGTTYDLSVEKHFLTATTAKTCFRTTFRTTSKTPLSNLLDEFVVDTPRSSTAQFHTPRFVYSLVAALIIQFSAVPSFVPALAPVLFGFALIHFIGLLRHANPMQQTRISAGKSIPRRNSSPKWGQLSLAWKPGSCATGTSNPPPI